MHVSLLHLYQKSICPLENALFQKSICQLENALYQRSIYPLENALYQRSICPLENDLYQRSICPLENVLYQASLSSHDHENLAFQYIKLQEKHNSKYLYCLPVSSKRSHRNYLSHTMNRYRIPIF
uniref:Putative ovule protein n=1 Tax=Solanum chacoense TaxID=4108 RepID=A0A0V0ICM8_SOLCH